jgi:RNase P/RNase MRP subunit POP5
MNRLENQDNRVVTAQQQSSGEHADNQLNRCRRDIYRYTEATKLCLLSEHDSKRLMVRYFRWNMSGTSLRAMSKKYLHNNHSRAHNQ